MANIAVRSLRKCRAATDLTILSLCLTACIQRFGVYATDEITLTPDTKDTHLGVDLGLRQSADLQRGRSSIMARGQRPGEVCRDLP
jgi:hypothetical protein